MKAGGLSRPRKIEVGLATRTSTTWQEDTHVSNPFFAGCENRRIAPRLAKVFPVAVVTEGEQTIESRALNVSSTGLRLVSDTPSRSDQEVLLHLSFAEQKVELKGRPVWHRRVGRSHVIGVSFHPGQGDAETRLITWLREQGMAA